MLTFAEFAWMLTTRGAPFLNVASANADRAEEKRAGCRRAIRQGTLDENEREQLVRVH